MQAAPTMDLELARNEFAAKFRAAPSDKVGPASTALLSNEFRVPTRAHGSGAGVDAPRDCLRLAAAGGGPRAAVPGCSPARTPPPLQWLQRMPPPGEDHSSYQGHRIFLRGAVLFWAPRGGSSPTVRALLTSARLGRVCGRRVPSLAPAGPPLAAAAAAGVACDKHLSPNFRVLWGELSRPAWRAQQAPGRQSGELPMRYHGSQPSPASWRLWAALPAFGPNPPKQLAPFRHLCGGGGGDVERRSGVS